ncbi:MAG: 30S ribosomal protein S11 [bacterium]|nr:30S ribosomal protein S11 [bacterium]
MAKATKTKKKSIGLGVLYVNASFNNTMLTLTDKEGDTLAWSSSGKEGFSGSKKSTPFAAAQVTKTIIEAMKKMGITQLEIIASGVGNGRDSALRMVSSSGADIISIADRTPMPHNGCRPRKSRRA